MQAAHCISQGSVWVSVVDSFSKKQAEQKKGGESPGYEGSEQGQGSLATVWLYCAEQHLFLKLPARGNQISFLINNS